MPKISLPQDFAKEIAQSLGMTDKWVDECFEIDENKEGYFIAKLKPKKFLERDQFRTLCALARDLGGEGYLRGAKAWAIPGPLAKKPLPQANTTSTPQLPSTSKPSDVRSKPEVEEPDYYISKSIPQVGYLYPVLKDAEGNVIDGYHRLQSDPNWPVQIIENIRDPAQLVLARLVANVCRREVSAQEKTEWLKKLATLTGWTPKQIADNLPVSYRWVMKYIPDELKERPGAGPTEYPVARRATQTPQVEPKSVVCTRCGVATSEPIHLDGKFYCGQCAEKVVAPAPSQEARRAVQPEAQASTSPSTAEYIEPTKETGAPPEEEHVEPPEPEPEKIDTGFQWECPECHRKLQLIHIKHPNGKIKHAFEGDE